VPRSAPNNSMTNAAPQSDASDRIDQGEALIAAFFAARGRYAEHAFNLIMDLCCPRELDRFLKRLQSSDHPNREDILSRPILRDLLGQKRLQGFNRFPICRDVMLYSDGSAPQGKALLLCFGGLGGRLGLPLSVLLQWIDAKRFDVVTLRDPSQSRFRLGAGTFAPDFGTLIRNIRDTFAPQRYARVIALGNSMGGNPAVHYAVLAGAERAISIGAQLSSDPLRLILGIAVPTAFDPLCDCLQHRPLRGIWLYGEAMQQDLQGGEDLFRRAGGQRLVIPGFDDHNALGLFWTNGELDRMLALLLDSNLPQPRSSRAKAILLRDPISKRAKRVLERLLLLARRVLGYPRRLARRVLKRRTGPAKPDLPDT
jgi:hypothetical protein